MLGKKKGLKIMGKAIRVQRADRTKKLRKLSDLNRKASFEYNSERAIRFYQNAIALGNEIGGKPKELARSYFALGSTYRGKRKFSQAKSNYENALNIYEKNEDPIKVRKTESVLEKLAEERNTLGNKILRRAGFATAVIGFLSAVFFMTNSFTGYAIAGINQQSSGLFGVVLFLIGVVGLYFFIKKK